MKHLHSDSCQTILSSLCLLFNLSQSLHQLHGLTSNLLCFLLSIFSLFLLTLEQSPDRRIVHKYTSEKKTISPDSSFLKQREHTANCDKKEPSLLPSHLPLHLPLVLLLPGLGLHLLHLNGVRFTSAHVQVMIPHTQGQDAFVDAKTRYVKNKIL